MSSGEPGWVRGYAVDPRSLAVARVAYCVYLLFFVDLSQFTFLADLPRELWSPRPGPMRLWTAPPSRTFLLVLLGSIQVLAALVAVGWRTRASSWSLAAGVLLLVGLSTCTGKIDHNIFLWLTPAFMAGQWGRAWSADAGDGRGKSEVDPLPLAAFALVVAFAMFSAGLPKLLGGWLSPSTQATRGNFLRNYMLYGRTQGLADLAVGVSSKALWEIGDWVTVVWELSFLFLVRRPKVFRFLLASAIGFHVGVLLILNIGFSSNLTAYAALTPWFAGALRDRDSLESPKRRPWLAPAALAAGLVIALSPSVGHWLARCTDYRPLPSALAFGFALGMLGGHVFANRRGDGRRGSRSGKPAGPIP